MVAEEVCHYARHVQHYDPRRNPGFLYCAMVAILHHPNIMEHVNEIANIFENTGRVSNYQLWFIEGLTMSRVITENHSRNEACYKLVMRDLEVGNFHHSQYEVDGEMKNFWVYQYKSPKQYRISLNSSDFFEGIIVMDEELKELFDLYIKIRPRPTISGDPLDSTVFLNSTGGNLTSISWVVKRFYAQIDRDEWAHGCNLIRKSVAYLEFEPFCRRVIAEAFSANLHLIAGHDLSTRYDEYIVVKAPAGIAASVKLKALARQEAAHNPTVVTEACRGLVINERPPMRKTFPGRAPTAQGQVRANNEESYDSDAPSDLGEQNGYFGEIDEDFMGPDDDNEVEHDETEEVQEDPYEENVTQGESQGTKNIAKIPSNSQSLDYTLDDAGSQQLTEIMLQSSVEDEIQKEDIEHADADGDIITSALRTHNAIECHKFPHLLPVNTTRGLVDFLLRCYNTPVQSFEWIGIFNLEGVGWAGYAKCNIPTKTLISDYLGKITPEALHETWRKNLRPDEASSVNDYAVSAHFNSKPFVVTAHKDVYKSTIGLAKYFNHSPCKKCCNVRGQPIVFTIGDVTLYKAGTQFLWNYGDEYENETNKDWYHLCPNEFCERKIGKGTAVVPVMPTILTSRKILEVPYQDYPSYSQIDKQSKPGLVVELPFNTIQMVAKIANILPSQLAIGHKTNDMHTLVKNFVLPSPPMLNDWELAAQNLSIEPTFTHFIRTLNQITRSFIVFYGKSVRDYSLKCLRVGNLPAIMIVWYELEKSFASVFISVDGVDDLSSRLSSDPTIILEREIIENPQHDFDDLFAS